MTMLSYLEASAPFYPWVIKWLLALKRGENIVEPNEHLDRPGDPLMGLKVVDFLDSNQCASVRETAIAIKIPPSTGFDHLRRWAIRSDI
jgi:hypothetical protein